MKYALVAVVCPALVAGAEPPQPPPRRKPTLQELDGLP